MQVWLQKLNSEGVELGFGPVGVGCRGFIA